MLIAAQYSGASVRTVSEPPDFELGKTNRTDSFLCKFPLGKVQYVSDGGRVFHLYCVQFWGVGQLSCRLCQASKERKTKGKMYEAVA